MKKERVLRVNNCDIHLVGVIHGLEREGERVKYLFEEINPGCIALGIPKEDIATIKKFVDDGIEFDMLPEQKRFFEILSHYGKVSIPPPDLVALYKLSEEKGVDLEAIDMDDEHYADVFTKKVSLINFIRNSRRNKKLLKREFDFHSAEEFVEEWEKRYNSMKSFRAIEKAREENMASRLLSLSDRYEKILAVVPYQRFDGIAELLSRD
ncbi:MAG: hypothetical protein J7J34_05270 [Thermoplasmata archaeon]|nr:hypothetical protein [Thermoplasmata archaeon]